MQIVALLSSCIAQKMWMWILIGLSIITKVHGFSDRNFPQSCDNLSPQHPTGRGTDFTAQTTAAPFVVEFERTKPKEPITVVLRRNESTQFRGFLMEAREATNSSSTIGTFILLDSSMTQLMTCNGLAGSTVRQSNNQRKSLIRVNWTAPEINQDIIFRATFVQDFAVFWENVTATFRLSTTTPEPSTTITTTTQRPTTTTPEPSTTITTTTQRPTTTTPEQSTTITTTTLRPTTTTPEQSTTTNTPKQLPITGVAEQSTTTSTATNTTKLRPTTTTPEQSTTTSTTTNTTTLRPTPTTPPPPPPPKLVGIVLMFVDLISDEAKMEMAVVMAEGSCHRLLSEIILSILCLGVEISALILFSVGESCIILVGLVCGVIMMNIAERAFWALTVRRILGRSGILARKMCFVVHQSVTLAVLYVCVLDICGEKWGGFWHQIVLIALTVWTFLATVWILRFSTQKKEIEEANETEVYWRRDQRTALHFQTRQGLNHSQQTQTKNHSAVPAIVSVLFIIVSTGLAVAVIVGIFKKARSVH